MGSKTFLNTTKVLPLRYSMQSLLLGGASAGDLHDGPTCVVKGSTASLTDYNKIMGCSETHVQFTTESKIEVREIERQ